MDPEEQTKAEEDSSNNEKSRTSSEVPARSIHGLKWPIAVTAVLSTTFLFSLDTTIVADVQPGIIKQFGEEPKLAWLGTAFALGSAATILPWSKAYGTLNIKWLYVSHIIIFEAGSALCGAAPTMNAMIVGRAIAGLGASGMYTGCLTYLSVMTTIQERPLYMGLIGLVWGLGTVLGPIIGGAFVDSNATWRWAFYINLVVGAIFLPACLFLLPSIDFQAGSTLKSRIVHQFDLIGIITFMGMISCLTMALTFGGTLYAWNSSQEIVLWVLTGVLFGAFVFSQWLHPLVDYQHKLYPSKFMRRPTLVILQVLMFIAALGLLVPTYYIPLLFQFARGGSALDAGVRLLPFVAMVVVFSLANGILMPKLGYYMPWYLVGGSLMLIGAALMYTVYASTPSAAVYGFSVLLGAGAGCFLQAGYAVSQALVDPNDIANAVGFMSIAQSLGIVVSLGIAGAIFQNRAVGLIAQLLPSLDLEALRGAVAGTNSNLLQTLPKSSQGPVLVAIVSALDDVYVLVMVGGAVTVLLSCFLPKSNSFKQAD